MTIDLHKSLIINALAVSGTKLIVATHWNSTFYILHMTRFYNGIFSLYTFFLGHKALNYIYIYVIKRKVYSVYSGFEHLRKIEKKFEILTSIIVLTSICTLIRIHLISTLAY